MADNTVQNGTDTIATDDIGGVKFQRMKLVHGADGVNAGDVSTANALPALLTANPGSYWPQYGAPSDGAQRSALIDDDGALQTRGAILTDEGTFRCNFANSSLFVSIGSVTVSGSTVIGTGFLTADVHRGDYFKVAADADTACVQIDSIDSDTQITLKSAYSGSASGTGNRALVMPYTGSGGSQSVASGALTLNSGTTNSAVTGVKRFIDYGPLVFRDQVTVSQRIANQTVYVGLSEDASTPRWFARYKIDGTTNTMVICETGRNPTGAPSASETQSTTVTLPNGATTASAREYRVEMLTEAVRFYIDGVLVAEHVNVMPAQYDNFAAVTEIRNGTGAGSTTAVTVDYITAKNHNKLEIGVMSDAEKLVASQPPLSVYNYNVSGVIAINTDLLVIDCTQIRSLAIQCVSMGTSGVVTPAVSNNGVNWTAYPVQTPTGSFTTTINSAAYVFTSASARYFRLRLTTATTAGTTTFVVTGAQATGAASVTQVAGTVTANVGSGALNAGSNAIGDVGVQYRASATGAASAASVISPATPAAGTVKASAGRVIGWQLQNSATGVRSVKLFNATAPTLGTTSAVFEIDIPAGGRSEVQLPGGIGFSTACTYSVTSAKGLTDNTATGLALGDVSGAFFYA